MKDNIDWLNAIWNRESEKAEKSFRGDSRPIGGSSRGFDWEKEGPDRLNDGENFRCDSSPIDDPCADYSVVNYTIRNGYRTGKLNELENLKRVSRKINEAMPTAAYSASRLNATLNPAPELSSDRFNGTHVIELERRLTGVTRAIKRGELGDMHSVDASFPDYVISSCVTIHTTFLRASDKKHHLSLLINGENFKFSSMHDLLNVIIDIDRAHAEKLKAEALKNRPILTKAADWLKSAFN